METVTNCEQHYLTVRSANYVNLAVGKKKKEKKISGAIQPSVVQNFLKVLVR